MFLKHLCCKKQLSRSQRKPYFGVLNLTPHKQEIMRAHMHKHDGRYYVLAQNAAFAALDIVLLKINIAHSFRRHTGAPPQSWSRSAWTCWTHQQRVEQCGPPGEVAQDRNCWGGDQRCCCCALPAAAAAAAAAAALALAAQTREEWQSGCP